MKRNKISLYIILIACTTLTACRSKQEVQPQQTMEAKESIDIDLTLLSSTLVYSQVFQMIVSPEDFMGKTIKIHGLCTCYHSELANKDYYSCYVQDAAACCSQGIAFTLNDSYAFPGDYPENNEEITLIGTFGTYQEGKYSYPMILNAALI